MDAGKLGLDYVLIPGDVPWLALQSGSSDDGKI